MHPSVVMASSTSNVVLEYIKRNSRGHDPLRLHGARLGVDGRIPALSHAMLWFSRQDCGQLLAIVGRYNYR